MDTFTYNIQILEPEIITVQEDNSQLLSVPFQIIKVAADGTGTIDVTLRHGFPLDITPEEVEADLNQVAETWAADIALGEKSAAIEKAQANANATISAIKGLKITNKASI